MQFKKISVIGLGYIGLPTAAMFASRGANVIGVDVSPEVVQTINRGEIHIVEPNLKELVHDCVLQNKLKATCVPEAADAFMIAVPTPFKNNDDKIPQPDLSFIRAACQAIAPVLKKGNLVVLESTSPVGTTEKVSEWLAELRPDLKFPDNPNSKSDIFIAHCPERVLPGKVLEELIDNDRIIGGITPRCSEAAKVLYEMFVLGECHVTNAKTAEMAKLTENASRDVAIAFANELSLICDKLDINPWELIELANKHPRVQILQPGPGVGGHCIAVDPWFIASSAPTNSHLIQLARKVNNAKPNWVLEKTYQMVREFNKLNSGHRPKVVCYGLAFKSNIDDLRESPALEIASKLFYELGENLYTVEPNIDDRKIRGMTNLSYEDAKSLGDIHVLLVDHDEFRSDPPLSSWVLDTRGCWR